MKYTDLCARLDYLSSPDAEHMPDGARLTSVIRCAVEAAAAIRELEAQVRESAMQELASLGQAQEAYEAQLAAEARVAELTRERDAVEALVKAAAQDAREVFEGCGSKAREAIDDMEQVALAAIRKGATP